MRIYTKEDLDTLLAYCRAIPYSETKNGGNFYKAELTEINGVFQEDVKN